ncbi:MAG: hypothetical protein AB7K24_30860, partial [Gemmataceae bacterium]
MNQIKDGATQQARRTLERRARQHAVDFALALAELGFDHDEALKAQLQQGAVATAQLVEARETQPVLQACQRFEQKTQLPSHAVPGWAEPRITHRPGHALRFGQALTRLVENGLLLFGR